MSSTTTNPWLVSLHPVSNPEANRLRKMKKKRARQMRLAKEKARRKGRGAGSAERAVRLKWRQKERQQWMLREFS